MPTCLMKKQNTNTHMDSLSFSHFRVPEHTEKQNKTMHKLYTDHFVTT